MFSALRLSADKFKLAITVLNPLYSHLGMPNYAPFTLQYILAMCRRKGCRRAKNINILKNQLEIFVGEYMLQRTKHNCFVWFFSFVINFQNA